MTISHNQILVQCLVPGFLEAITDEVSVVITDPARMMRNRIYVSVALSAIGIYAMPHVFGKITAVAGAVGAVYNGYQFYNQTKWVSEWLNEDDCRDESIMRYVELQRIHNGR